MFFQLNDLLLVSKALTEENSGLELPEVHTKETRNYEIVKTTKTRTEKARSEFTFKTCRIADPPRKFNKLKGTIWTEKCNITYNVEFF